ncbi:hypothetical protein M153_6910004334 [Pseudoloma neurophilia]|uniref:Uncharacterized protein n=1 Tax=Pseudoloma neurophilia TaxID=146866 RepID=A0A0R0M2G5_9MICR|nr:hypothetical protein M153_6910004334 [Pseudoloma neurophilia]
MILLPGEILPEQTKNGVKREKITSVNRLRHVVDTSTGRNLFYEPEPVIGVPVKCIVQNVTLGNIDLIITEINEIATKVKHKAVYKPPFINQDENSKFLFDEFKTGDVFNGIVEDFCDQNGIILKRI